MYGKVKWFDDKLGFGFIESKEEDNVFVHFSEIKCRNYKTLIKDQYVYFNLVSTEKGYKATDVIVIKE